MSTWRAVFAAAALTLVACSNDNGATPDAGTIIVPDAAVPAPDAAVATFAAYVKDLILNKTADNTPAGAVDFTSADSDDPLQFESLF
jgi:hypothetical protein